MTPLDEVATCVSARCGVRSSDLPVGLWPSSERSSELRSRALSSLWLPRLPLLSPPIRAWAGQGAADPAELHSIPLPGIACAIVRPLEVWSRVGEQESCWAGLPLLPKQS